MNLHVDRHLKPYHLLTNQSNAWISTDPRLEERRRKCIVQYLLDGESVTTDDHQTITRYVSMDDLDNGYQRQKVRHNSLDDIYLRCYDPPDAFLDNFTSFRLADWQQQPSVIDDDNNRCSPSSAAGIMERLDFQVEFYHSPICPLSLCLSLCLSVQVNQRNERSHFILSELLIQTIEFIYADELLRRSSSNFVVRGASTVLASLSDSELLLNVTSVRPALSSPSSQSIIEPCSRAETMAEILLDDILHISPLMNVRHRFKRTFPSSLQLLIRRLDRQREFSSCEKPDRSQPHQRATEDQDATGSHRPDCLSDYTDDKIKALVETCSYPLNIPVGQYSVMGTNQSLPTYVVTMTPVPASQASVLCSQNNKCPGCPLSFCADTARRLRLCRYYGFYFCSVCHSNTLMLIPARVLSSWDFTMLPVSCVARDFLRLIHSEALFSLEHFSDKLRNALPVLRSVMRLRQQGRLLLDFIETCRQGLSLRRAATKFPPHWLSNGAPKFSLADFQLMESGVMVEELRVFATACVEHISICPLCQAHGFLCELCDNKSDVIFPFEIDKVHRCPLCLSCSHIRCHERAPTRPCQKCERRKLREEQRRNAAASAATMAAETVQ